MNESAASEKDVEAAGPEECQRVECLFVKTMVKKLNADWPTKLEFAEAAAYAAGLAAGRADERERCARVADAIWLPDKSGSIVAAAIRRGEEPPPALSR